MTERTCDACGRPTAFRVQHGEAVECLDCWQEFERENYEAGAALMMARFALADRPGTALIVEG